MTEKPAVRVTEKACVLEDVSVIVPTLGRPVLERCLASIARGSHWPARLIVNYQGEGSHVAGWVERLDRLGMSVHLNTSTQRGVAAARNRAIERVTTRFFVINDDDQVAEREWLVRMHGHLQARLGVVITGSVLPEAQGVPSSIAATRPVLHRRPLLHRDVLFAGNMGASLSVYERIGPFDERPALNGAEDNDWAYRLLRAGVPIYYAPDAAVTHLDWRGPQELALTLRRYARAQGGFYGKHLRRGDPFIAARAARDMLRGPWLLLRAAIDRNPDLAMLGSAETRGILPGIVAGFRQCSRPVQAYPM